MSTTNGYTIRLELLKMAKELLEQDYHMRRDALVQDWSIKSDKSETPIPFPEVPTFPTEEQIIAKARVLNEFINQKQ